MNLCFLFRTTVRRESDPPWINRHVRALIRKRRKVYHREGRSFAWKGLMKKVLETGQETGTQLLETSEMYLAAEGRDAGLLQECKGIQ